MKYSINEIVYMYESYYLQDRHTFSFFLLRFKIDSGSQTFKVPSSDLLFSITANILGLAIPYFSSKRIK